MFRFDCPDCGKKRTYSRMDALKRATKKNCRCFVCAKRGKNNNRFGKRLSKITKEKMRVSHIEYAKTAPFTLQSKSATTFLDCIEKMIHTKIEREFELGGRFFDGKLGNILIEVDGRYWHTDNPIDALKEEIAKKHKFVLMRFEVNNEREIPSVLETIKERIHI